MRAAPTAFLNVVDFGKELVSTGDLDPVYVALQAANLSPSKLRRFLLAYWCFYHCGTASWIVDRPKMHYWSAMIGAAESSKYPRGTERRHFRGELALKSIAFLREHYGTPEEVFAEFDRAGYEQRVVPLGDVMELVQLWVGFGPWIAFKVADMLERLGILRIEFSAADTFLFDSPREGAKLVCQHYANGEHVSEEKEPEWSFTYLERYLGDMMAPPRYERKLNGQEFETILCKWKSHLNGHYPPGHDIHELREGLLRFAKQPTAQLLLRSL